MAKQQEQQVKIDTNEVAKARTELDAIVKRLMFISHCHTPETCEACAKHLRAAFFEANRLSAALEKSVLP